MPYAMIPATAHLPPRSAMAARHAVPKNINPSRSTNAYRSTDFKACDRYRSLHQTTDHPMGLLRYRRFPAFRSALSRTLFRERPQNPRHVVSRRKWVSMLDPPSLESKLASALSPLLLASSRSFERARPAFHGFVHTSYFSATSFGFGAIFHSTDSFFPFRRTCRSPSARPPSAESHPRKRSSSGILVPDPDDNVLRLKFPSCGRRFWDVVHREPDSRDPRFLLLLRGPPPPALLTSPAEAGSRFAPTGRNQKGKAKRNGTVMPLL